VRSTGRVSRRVVTIESDSADDLRSFGDESSGPAGRIAGFEISVRIDPEIVARIDCRNRPLHDGGLRA
jgi:hypothetical protein